MAGSPSCFIRSAGRNGGRPVTDEGTPAIPDDVLALLHDRVSSFEELEVLLLTRRDPSRAWSVDAIALSLNLRAEEADAALTKLVVLGLMRKDESGLVYSPGDYSETIDRLARAYEENRMQLMKQMTANAIERLRTGAARAFARAFVIRRGGKGDG
jgi:hypothetical protein